jgi:hypothetical protein
VTIIRSVQLFALAAPAETGGAWLIWQGVREHKGMWWTGAGIAALGAYGFVATLQAAIAFADPLPRPDIGMPGHIGQLYRTLGAWYCDRATARSGMIILPDNTAISDRSIQKVRSGERGASGVVSRLQLLGAPPKPDLIDGTTWLAQAFAALKVRRVRHRGVHRFIFALGTQRQRRLVEHDLTDAFAPLDYPSQPDPLPVYR